VSENDPNLPPPVPPAAAGPAGARFEGKVGALYFLALIGGGEPRGLLMRKFIRLTSLILDEFCSAYSPD